MKKFIKSLVRARIWKETKGQDLVEYGLLVGFITVAVAAAWPPVGGSLTTIFSKLTSILSRA